MVLKIVFGKLGNIGCAPLLEFLLDERAERKDIDVRTVGSGAKMGVEQASEVANAILEVKPDLAVVSSPNCALPGPTNLRELLTKAGIPTIVISDNPGKKAIAEIEKLGAGYMIVEADSMIGARREFLDPTEMTLFNADLLKVLSVSGVLNVLWQELDRVIRTLQKREVPTLPKLVVGRDAAIQASGLNNPYAVAKALASHEIARRVSDLTTEGCFVVKDWERYTRLVSAAHEMMRDAGRLADEAREIEKEEDAVLRTPHSEDGRALSKRKLLEKPKEIQQLQMKS